MTPRLTDDQRQAIEQTGGKPVDVLDTATNIHYVLLRADQYDRVRVLLEPQEADTDPREAYLLVDAVMAEDDAVDPSLDSYQRFGQPSS